jgi:uroporphyrinogen-III synthase
MKDNSMTQLDLTACFDDNGSISWAGLRNPETLAAFFALTEGIFDDLSPRQQAAVEYARGARPTDWLAHRARAKGFKVSATANPPTRYVGARAERFPTLADQREEFDAILLESAETQRLAGKRTVGWDQVVADVNSKIR